MLDASVLLIVFLQCVQCTPTFSSTKLTEYLATENNIDQIIDFKMAQFNQISSKFQKLAVFSRKTIKKEVVVSNPLTANVLVRRLAQDWTRLAIEVSGHSAMPALNMDGVRWPDSEDLKAAYMAVERAQSAYQLSSKDLVHGVVGKSEFSVNVTAADSFNMAVHYFFMLHFTEAAQWLQQALVKIGNGDESENAETVLMYLVPALCFSGDTKGSQSTLKTLLKINRSPNLPHNIVEHYYRMAYNNCDVIHKEFIWHKNHMLFSTQQNGSKDHYKQLCQFSRKVPEGLHCRYMHYQQPHLRFQPFKMEELQLNPPIVRFYDAITEEEVMVLRRRALPSMKQATVIYSDGPKAGSTYRTSHTAWLYDKDEPVAARLSRRAADMTQLDLTHAEGHQLSRYGMAGEFLPHTDQFRYNKTFEDNRLATIMYYLSDVEQGGNTVFLQWGLSVPPVKNSAILWFHFLPNGDVDETSEHSGCPVLEGSKWVINRWLKTGDNMFRMPCGTSMNASYQKYYSQ